MRLASPSHRQSMTKVQATADFRSIIRQRLDNSSKLIGASIQWTELIMRKIDNAFSDKQTLGLTPKRVPMSGRTENTVGMVRAFCKSIDKPPNAPR